MHKGFKYRLYPTQEQAEKINRTLGCCRYVYNHMLDRRQKAYKRRGERMTYIDMQNLLPGMKKYLPWLAEADSQALKYACRQLDTAYKNFFLGAGFPKYKSRHDHRQSYTTTAASSIHVFEKTIQLPTLGEVPCRVSRQIRGKICRATVSRTPSGKYFVSVLCDVDDMPAAPVPVNEAIGLDVGITCFATDNNGRKYENPKYFNSALKRLRREQRRLSRKQKGSKNREKQRVIVARCYEKVANRRNDFLHKLSTSLINEN